MLYVFLGSHKGPSMYLCGLKPVNYLVDRAPFNISIMLHHVNVGRHIHKFLVKVTILKCMTSLYIYKHLDSTVLKTIGF